MRSYCTSKENPERSEVNKKRHYINLLVSTISRQDDEVNDLSDEAQMPSDRERYREVVSGGQGSYWAVAPTS